MKYYFTKEQFRKYWFEVNTDWESSSTSESVEYYNRRNLFKQLNPSLSYEEYPVEDTDENRQMQGFYGIIEGDEKDINWFLLQL